MSKPQTTFANLTNSFLLTLCGGHMKGEKEMEGDMFRF